MLINDSSRPAPMLASLLATLCLAAPLSLRAQAEGSARSRLCRTAYPRSESWSIPYSAYRAGEPGSSSSVARRGGASRKR